MSWSDAQVEAAAREVLDLERWPLSSNPDDWHRNRARRILDAAVAARDEPDPRDAAIGEVLALRDRDAGPSDDPAWDQGYDSALAEVAAIIAEHVNPSDLLEEAP